ncbi:dgat2 [Symbiodinium sp. CCMP2592]|nr:dgat2 [Symbiodinium sp. CCMP2592]
MVRSWLKFLLAFLALLASNQLAPKLKLMPKLSSGLITLCQVPVAPALLCASLWRRYGVGSVIGLLTLLRLGAVNRDLEGGYTVDAFRNLPVWRWAREQMNTFRILGNPVLRDEKRILFCCHPHGTMSLCGQFLSTVPDALQQLCGGPVEQSLRIAVTHVFMKIPFQQNIARWCGCIPARKDAVKVAFEKNSHVVIFPGVASEAGAAAGSRSAGLEKLYVSNKLLASMKEVAKALGPIAIVPVYVRGESEAFRSQPLVPASWTGWCMKMFQFVPVLPVGWMGLPVARSVDYAVAVGEPLKLDESTDLSELSTSYEEELKRVFRTVHDGRVEVTSLEGKVKSVKSKL